MPPPKYSKSEPLSPDVLEARRFAETLERELIFGIMRSHKFYKDIRGIICPWDDTTLQHRKDFSVDRYNTLYRAMDAHYRRFDTLTNPSANLWIPPAIVSAVIVDWANRNGVMMTVAEELLKEIEDERAFTMSLTYESLSALKQSDAFKEWINSRVLEHTVGHIHSQKGIGKLTLQGLEEALTSARRATNLSQPSNFYNASNILYDRRIRKPCIRVPEFRSTMLAVGRTLNRGEATMIAGCNGGGKTILAMHWARLLAKSGFKVMFVTTERTPTQLLLRSIADACNIDYGRLHDDSEVEVEEDTPFLPEWMWNDPTYSAILADIDEYYASNFLMVDWSTGTRNTVKDQLPAQIDNAIQAGFKPDVLIFDWIGGGLDAVKDKDKLRLYYQDAADSLCYLAKQYNLHVVMMAQLDKVAAENKSFVTMNMLSECKGMTNLLTNWIGITSLVDKNPIDGKPMRKREQFLCIGKSSEGPGGRVRVEAAFESMKFREPCGNVSVQD